jgi:dTMP kinase
LILDPANHEMAAVTEALLYAAARAQHAEEVIKPLLSAGRIVLSDRYMDSSLAYQGVGRRLGDAVRQVNEIAVGGLQPNRTFLLALDPAVGLNRIDRAHDRLEAEAIDYHRMVYQGFLDLAQQHPDRIRVIRADQPSDQIHAEIIADLIDLDPGFEKLAEAIR